MSDGKIIVKIDPLGNPTVEAEGFSGGECIEATKGIEQALSGVDTTGRKLKAEYYEEDEEKASESTGVGW